MTKRRNYKELRRSLGLRVRSLRRARGWSQMELGERAGLDHTYVGGIERGERNPSLEALDQLAQGLGLSLGELFQFAAKGTTPSDAVMEIIALLQGQDRKTVELAHRLVRAALVEAGKS